MQLEFVEKAVRDMDGTRYVRESYSIGGYAVHADSRIYADGDASFDVRCRVIVEDRYLPEIYYRDGWFGQEPRFEIQTTSYGPLKPSEFKKFLEAQQEALKVVEVLNKKFIENDDLNS